MFGFIRKIFRKNDYYTVEESRAIYSTNAIFGLAQSLLGIFIPIYIFNLSQDYLVFSDNSIINGFIWVVCYFALSSLMVVLSILVFHELIFRWTLKKTLFYSQIYLIAAYACLSLAESSLYMIFLAAVFTGIHTTFYWIPYHIFFVKRADDGDKKYGTETGRRDFLSGLSSALGPLMGALIISQLGFSMLYGFAIILLLVSVLPIIIFVHEQDHRDHSFRDVYFNYLKNKDYIKTSLALGGNMTSNAVFMIFWSLMLYFGLKSFVEIGMLTTLSGIVALILLLLVGKIIDKKGKLYVHSFGVVVNSLLHLVRPFFSSALFLYTNGILDNINAPFYSVPFSASVYEKSLKGSSVSDFLIYREMVMHGTRFLVLVLIGIVLFFTSSWMWVFFVGAFGSALTILVNF